MVGMRYIQGVSVLNALSNFPQWLLFLIVVGGSIGLIWCATLATSLWMKGKEQRELSELHKAASSSVSTVLTFLLGFLVVTSWGNFRSADQAVAQEAASMTVLARAAQALPPQTRTELLTYLQQYIELVITDEWPIMAQGHSQASPRAVAAFGKLWTVCQDRIASVPACQNVQNKLGDLTSYRVLRVLSSRSYLPDAFWLVLILGALMVILMSLFLSTSEVGMGKQLLIRAFKIGAIAMLLWLIIIINNPYAGDAHITPDAFQYPLFVIKSIVSP
jgi:hypothetical protein